MFRKKIRLVVLLFLFLTASQVPLVLAAPKNGVYKDFYSNGALRMKTKYKKGALIYKKIFYKNGALSKYYVYQGRKRIKQKTYYENGRLQSVWTEKSGEAKYYTKQGRLKAVVKDRPNEALAERLPPSLL